MNVNYIENSTSANACARARTHARTDGRTKRKLNATAARRTSCRKHQHEFFTEDKSVPKVGVARF